MDVNMYLALVFNVSFIFRKVTLSDHNTSPATLGILTRKPLSTEHTRQYNNVSEEAIESQEWFLLSWNLGQHLPK